MKKLSIITINYNNAVGLDKTINSIKNQTLLEIEFIVIDGGSTDGSLKIIKKNSSIIDYSVSEEDGGVYQAMNKGIMKATGEYCLFLNSGDYLANERVLENVFNNILDEEIVYGNVIKIKPHYRRLIRFSPTLTFYDFYQNRSAIHHQSTFIKRVLFNKYGLYNEDFKIIGDWEFFFKVIILKQAKTKFLDMVISIVDGTGLSNNMKKDNPLRLDAYLEKENILKLNFPEYILLDYKRLDKIISNKSLFNRIINKITYFRLKR